MRITLAQLNPIVGDIEGNQEKIIYAIKQAKNEGADIILTSELALLGYPPLDLLFLHGFLERAEKALERIRKECEGITAVIGTIRGNDKLKEKFLFNSACVIQNNAILGFYDKHLLPTYDVFDERRYFEPGDHPFVFELKGKRLAVTICEDLWGHAKEVKETNYMQDPIRELGKESLNFLLNISASPYSVKKIASRERVAGAASFSLNCPVILCNQVGCNDGLLFDGHSFVINQTGEILFRAKSFEEEIITIDTEHIQKPVPLDPIETLYKGVVLGVRDFLHKQKRNQVGLGLSGGIDSALVATILCDALGKENVHALFMPSRFTKEDSYENVKILSEWLGISCKEINIEPLFQAYINELNPKEEKTLENLQARIRGMLLMAHSNEYGYLVINTSNKSENAMGFATMYGDTCGAFCPIADLYKLQVYALSHYKKIPLSIIEKVPSAELKENQKDSDTMPEYPVLDPILEDIIENNLSIDEISKKYNKTFEFTNDIFKKIFLNEYKRKQNPPLLRVSEKSLILGRHVPIVQRAVS